MKSYTEIIDKYLSNELSPTEKKSFEEELKTNEELKQQFEVQKEIMKGIQQQGLRTDVNKAVKKVKLNKLIKTAVVLTLTVAVAVLGTYYMKKNVFSKPTNHVQYELNEQGNTNWSEADKNLESQIFKIDPTKDTIIETQKGIIFQIKAGTFLNKSGSPANGPVDLEVKEAMTAYDIMKAGLSTTSNGELLETGGMFYINARNGNEVLGIDKDKAIKVHVPSGTDKKMSLFDSERLKDGSINWINPKPMQKQLRTMDILSLDFYPPDFIDSLKGMGYDVKNKILTDSIYYSFAFEGPKTETFSYDNDTEERADTLKRIKDSTPVYRQNSEINPSRIRAIWDKKFDGTILATKQFEERLKVIFTTCNAAVFTLYAENLGKELWELDSMAANMLSGEQKEKFLEFYKRKEGGVDISDAQGKQLQDYMREKKNFYDKVVNDALTKLYSDENKKTLEATSKRNDHEVEKYKRLEKNFCEELDKNMVEAYKQLEKPYDSRNSWCGARPVLVAPNYLSGVITQPGWLNVDHYVWESTINRTTLDYTDKETGKRAVIEYKEASVEIEDQKNFDRVICYLLPEQLSSFQLMKTNENGFFEKLNMTFKYSIIVVAYKGSDTYYYDVKDAQPQKYSVKMKKIDAGSLIGRINSRYNLTGTRDIIKDIDFGLFEQKESARTNKIVQREEIRNRLMRVVFPCGVWGALEMH